VRLEGSQALATCPYPEPDQSSPYSPSHFLQTHSIPCAKSQVCFPLRELYHRISPSTSSCEMFRNVRLYGGELLALGPTPKLDEHPLSAVRDCLFDIFAATFHFLRPFLYPQPEDASYCGDRVHLWRLCSVFASNSRLFERIVQHKWKSRSDYWRMNSRIFYSSVFIFLQVTNCRLDFSLNKEGFVLTSWHWSFTFKF
jgi:hypothetical protein